MNLEALQQEPDKMRQRISDILSSQYNYRPEPVQQDRIDLGIDWSSVDARDLFGDMPKEFDNIDGTYPGATVWEHEGKTCARILLINADLKSKNGNLQLLCQKIDDKVKDEVTFGFGIEDANNEVFPASFRFYQVKHGEYEEWDMKHRVVSEVYRNQGIASQMIRLAEEFFKKRARETGIKQIMTANIGQTNVLTALLKEGFVPTSKEDEEKINRLLNGDRNLIVVTGPDMKDKAKPQSYIFERDKYYNESGEVRPEIWNTYKNEPEKFLGMSFRINLKKEISKKIL